MPRKGRHILASLRLPTLKCQLWPPIQAESWIWYLKVLVRSGLADAELTLNRNRLSSGGVVVLQHDIPDRVF